MGGWVFGDILSLGEHAQRSILAQWETEIARDRQRGVKTDPDKIKAVTDLRNRHRPKVTDVPPPKGRPLARKGWDIGSLDTTETCAIQTADGGATIAVFEPVELVNRIAGRNPHVIDQVEARWTALVSGACTVAAIQPVPAPVDIWVHHIRERGGARKLADADSSHFPVKGGIDGLVHAGIIPDDGPGFVRSIRMLEAVWANTSGLVFEVVPAAPRRRFPLTAR